MNICSPMSLSLIHISGIFARSQEAKHLVIKQLALFLAALSATKQIQQSQGDFRIAVPIIACLLYTSEQRTERQHHNKIENTVFNEHFSQSQ